MVDYEKYVYGSKCFGGQVATEVGHLDGNYSYKNCCMEWILLSTVECLKEGDKLVSLNSHFCDSQIIRKCLRQPLKIVYFL